jgi:hypothetical protein
MYTTCECVFPPSDALLAVVTVLLKVVESVHNSCAGCHDVKLSKLIAYSATCFNLTLS